MKSNESHNKENIADKDWCYYDTKRKTNPKVLKRKKKEKSKNWEQLVKKEKYRIVYDRKNMEEGREKNKAMLPVEQGHRQVHPYL